jgi:hypothetical protein
MLKLYGQWYVTGQPANPLLVTTSRGSHRPCSAPAILSNHLRLGPGVLRGSRIIGLCEFSWDVRLAIRMLFKRHKNDCHMVLVIFDWSHGPCHMASTQRMFDFRSGNAGRMMTHRSTPERSVLVAPVTEPSKTLWSL